MLKIFKTNKRYHNILLSNVSCHNDKKLKSMKKIILLLLLVSFNYNLFSQITKGKIILSINGNTFKETIEKNASNELKYNTDGKYTDFEIKAEKLITNNLSLGFGLSYISGDEKFSEWHWISDRLSPQYIKEYFIRKQINTTNIVPNVNLRHNIPFLESVSLFTTFSFRYNIFKTDYSSVYDYNESNTSGYTYYQISSTDDDFNKGFISAELYPELVYYVIENLGLSLTLGGIEFTTIERENYDSGINIRFEPKYWKFGIQYILK